KMITESVDPNAKIIFGTVRDEKLKKGEIKITVIASGFPDSYMKKALFGDKESEAGEKGRIFNSVFSKEEKHEEKQDEKPKVVVSDDDDDWGAVPAFLRRSKLK
ncbi:MAG: cell division protein FtsZ, partial [Patescibacteria group bacterium]